MEETFKWGGQPRLADTVELSKILITGKTSEL